VGGGRKGMNDCFAELVCWVWLGVSLGVFFFLLLLLLFLGSMAFLTWYYTCPRTLGYICNAQCWVRVL